MIIICWHCRRILAKLSTESGPNNLFEQEAITWLFVFEMAHDFPMSFIILQKITKHIYQLIIFLIEYTYKQL